MEQLLDISKVSFKNSGFSSLWIQGLW